MRHRRRQLRLRRPHPIRRARHFLAVGCSARPGLPIEDSIAAVAPGVDGLAVHFVGDAERGRRPSSQDRRTAASVIPAHDIGRIPANGVVDCVLIGPSSIADAELRRGPARMLATPRGRSRDSVRNPRYRGRILVPRSPDEVRRFQGRDVTWVGPMIRSRSTSSQSPSWAADLWRGSG